MSKLYLECYSGISGDMTVGALLDLGADQKVLNEVLSTVPTGGFTTRISTVKKSMINACDFDVILEEDNHDHDMAYLYGKDAAVVTGQPEGGHHHHHDDLDHDHGDADQDAHDHSHDHHHDHDHHYDHDHHQDHDHHHDHNHDHGHKHGHVHRNLADVYEIIDGTTMTEGARAIAKKIFAIVAQAESEAHGQPVEEVHFHEVGAIDSIVDVIAIAVCYDNLRTANDITEVIVPVLYEGTGTVRTQHGLLPIPVPAVTSIARHHAIPLHIMEDQGEFVTPTGAAAVAALRTSEALPDNITILKTGLGAGKRAYKRAGVVRAMLLK